MRFVNILAYDPGLAVIGADMAVRGVSEAGHTLVEASASIVESVPDVAGAAVEGVGEAAGAVFEVIAEIIGGIFS